MCVATTTPSTTLPPHYPYHHHHRHLPIQPIHTPHTTFRFWKKKDPEAQVMRWGLNSNGTISPCDPELVKHGKVAPST